MTPLSHAGICIQPEWDPCMGKLTCSCWSTLPWCYRVTGEYWSTPSILQASPLKGSTTSQ
jgi:hypothetical protein